MNTGASEMVQQVMACCTTLTSEVQVQSSQKRGGENQLYRSVLGSSHGAHGTYVPTTHTDIMHTTTTTISFFLKKKSRDFYNLFYILMSL